MNAGAWTSLPVDRIEWSGHPVSVVSLGCGALSALSEGAVRAIERCEVVFGSGRHLSQIEGIASSAERRLFPSPFSRLAMELSHLQHRRLVVLASGDALFYGVGGWLNRVIGSRYLRFFPNISSVQAGFHHIGRPWQDAVVLSLHGRPLATLRGRLQDRQWLALFTDADSSPGAIARELDAQGFGRSRVWVCEAMGGEAQRVECFTAEELGGAQREFDPLNVCLIELRGYQPALPPFPGIGDHHFQTGAPPGHGMISKREVRLCILSLMQPGVDQVAWDVGAGCGSVSVEWARWNPTGQIYAVEDDPERMVHLIANNERFGTQLNLTPIEGTAPACCDALPAPDCVFIGGSRGRLEVLLDYCWSRLEPGGRLVAAAVTDGSREVLTRFAASRPGHEWVEVQVSKNLPGDDAVRQLRPVALMQCTRQGDSSQPVVQPAPETST